MDKGYLNGVIFLDLKKAFDCVNHDILIRKLKLYGCSENTLCWFKSYLTNRRHMCKIGRAISQERFIRCGVPQGSTLRPLLFLLYVNDHPSCLSHSIPSMFADDTNLTTSGKSIEDIQNQLNSDLENIGMLSRMKAYVPQDTLRTVCSALIMPHFDYCSLVWDNCSKYILEKLQKLQNRAARVITGKSYETRSSEI